jgi:outer membrane protein TolC
LICFLLIAVMPLHLSAQDPQLGTLQTPTAPAEPVRQDRSGEGMITKGSILTLDRCVAIALRQNPNLLAAIGTVHATQSRLGQSRAAYYPQIDATAAYNKTDSSSPLSRTTGTFATGTSRYEQYSGTVSLNQNIFDFGRTSSFVDIAKFNLVASRADLLSTENATVLGVKQSYYGVLQANRNREVAAGVIQQFQLHLDQAKGFYEVGTKARIDVIKAEVDLSNAKLRLINAENALKIAWVNLNNAMGVPDAPEYSIEDSLSFQPYVVTLEEATARAFENRPDLRSLVAQRQAAESNIGFARSGYYPSLSGSASYTKSGEDISSEQMSEGWQVGAVLTIPLFSGFLTRHQVAEAKSNLYVLKANEESLRQRILLDIRQAYLNLQAAEASIGTAELAARQARENLDLANGRYEAGVGSPVEVSDAFATYVSAEANYTSALANYKIAQATIENAMGLK